MHVPLPERVTAWLRAAEADRDAAALLVEHAPHLACFHAQQAAEKALKALLVARSGDAPPVHATVRLLAALDAIDEPVAGDVRDEAESLDKFHIPTRYPDALGFVDAALAYKPRDATAALAGADTVIGWARERLAT